MPNGGARDRVFVLMNCFFSQFGHWPTRVKVPAHYVRMLEAWQVGSDSVADKLKQRIELTIDDEAPSRLVAEDADGHSFKYGEAWPPPPEPPRPARGPAARRRPFGALPPA